MNPFFERHLNVQWFFLRNLSDYLEIHSWLDPDKKFMKNMPDHCSSANQGFSMDPSTTKDSLQLHAAPHPFHELSPVDEVVVNHTCTCSG